MPHEHGEAVLHGKVAMGGAVHQAWGSRRLEHQYGTVIPLK